MENIKNDITIHVSTISLEGGIFFSYYDYLNIKIPPRKSYTYDYSNLCTLYRRNLSGHIGYYSSEDNYRFAHFKEINLSCDSFLLIGLD